MKTPLRIEVEPLSEQRWAKIERSVIRQLELERLENRTAPPRRRLGVRAWLVAAAVVGALAASMLAIQGMPERAALEHPSRISTGQTPSHLALPGLAIDVEPQSAVVVSPETEQGLLIVLDRGSIVCQVAPRPSDAPLIVQAGALRIHVVGTRFSVTRRGESARVKVYEGAVEVTSAGQSLRVRAGEEWPGAVVEPRAGEPRPVPDPDPVVEAPAPSVPRNAARPSFPEIAQKKLVESGQPRAASEAVELRRPVEASTAPPGSAAQGMARPSPQAVFEQATALERSDPARASQLYRALESGTDSWAQNALYARGRLAASRGNPSEARRLLERYLERFPRGSNAEDARAVLRRLR